MIIRRAVCSDLDALLRVFERARAYMRETGNPTQWGNSHPTKEQTIQDIENGNCIILEENGKIFGTCAMIFGEDPTYGRIDGGKWLNNEPYVTLHRVASSGERGGILKEMLDYAFSRAHNVRIDTHRENAVMRHLLTKNGFAECGIIYLANGDPRIAYQKELNMKKTISEKVFDEERALYASDGIVVENCRFSGPADGESALKESRNCKVQNCCFELRYPFWHNHNMSVTGCELTESCRAAFWYDEDMTVEQSLLHGIKAFRECRNFTLRKCSINSAEFGWNCRDIRIYDSQIRSEYFLLNGANIEMNDTEFNGKYSFQYTKNGQISNCVLNTKDAFWHSENLTVTDSIVAGEYLGWYSKNLHLIRCKITGTQPLCYCENLVLEDCTMEGCDLAFEYSNVQATIRGGIASVKNPIHGSIAADRIDEVILDCNRKPDSDCIIKTRT